MRFSKEFQFPPKWYVLVQKTIWFDDASCGGIAWSGRMILRLRNYPNGELETK
jgi:hypothetical protein